jgi:imidazolonepropionase-like amidohydrolase
MRSRAFWRLAGVVSATLAATAACGGDPSPTADGLHVLWGARLIGGDGTVLTERGVVVVRDGRIAAVGPEGTTPVPEAAAMHDVTGRTIIPGLINAHGHVGATRGLESRPEFYTEDNLLAQLRQYARYGVTTVVSLGGDAEIGFRLRDASSGPLDRARLLVAGDVVTASTPEEARAAVDRAAAVRPDFLKIRVDDNLGTTPKMPLDVARAVIDQAHQHALRVAAHIFYLEDAKALVAAGVDLIAHSIRDQVVDDEVIALLRQRGVCVSPTLTRELSTFVYETEPDFFRDPFFLKGVASAVVAALRDPARRQRTPADDLSFRYKAALDQASLNAKRLIDAGIGLAFGTDTGPPGRFQGYFEHLEAEMLTQAGLRPADVIRLATSGTAQCLGLSDRGDLRAGNWADLIVLSGDPLADIRQTRSIESVWIGGMPVPQ